MRPADHHAVGLGLFFHLPGQLRNAREHARVRIGMCGEAIEHFAHLAKGEAAQPFGQHLADGVQPIAVQLFADADGGVADHARIRHDDQQRAAPRHADQVQAAHPQIALPGGQHQGGVVGQVAERLRAQGDDVLHIVHAGGKIPADAFALILAQSRGQQRIHIQAVGFIAGHAPGRHVRLDQVAHLLQVGHLIADGGAGYAQAAAFADGAAAHGGVGQDEILHDDLQDALFAIIEVHR